MKAVSYTLLFAILSPGLLLLVPSVFKAILKNPLSFVAIILNIAFFYMALTNIKYIPYLNTLEAFQDAAATQGTTATPASTATADTSEPQVPLDPDGKPLSEECTKCIRKASMFVQISSCEKDCPQSTEPLESCANCMKKNMPNLIKSHCSNVCPVSMLSGNLVQKLEAVSSN